MHRSIYGLSTHDQKWGTYQESSTSTPGFYKLKKKRLSLPLKSYSWRRIDGICPWGNTHSGLRTERETRGYLTFWEAVTNGSTSIPGGLFGDKLNCPSIPDLRNKVVGRVLDKVRDVDIDLGVTLGEYRETAAFVSSAMEKTAGFIRQLRRGNVSGALAAITGKRNPRLKDVADVAANTQLAVSYGLVPLIHDVYGACKALDKRNPPELEVLRKQSGDVVGVDCQKLSSNSYWKYKNHVKGEIRAKCVVFYVVDNPLYRKIDAFGLFNPLNIAWELVPLSFVVDWFIPVGNYLSSIVPPQGVKFQKGWESWNAKGSSFNSTHIVPAGIGGATWDTEASTIEVVKGRNVLGGFPRYHLVIPDLSLSKRQLANGMALLFQALK
jgi:hypothetical protein